MSAAQIAVDHACINAAKMAINPGEVFDFVGTWRRLVKGAQYFFRHKNGRTAMSKQQLDKGGERFEAAGSRISSHELFDRRLQAGSARVAAQSGFVVQPLHILIYTQSSLLLA